MIEMILTNSVILKSPYLALYLSSLDNLTITDYVVGSLTVLMTGIFFWQAWVAWKAVSR